MEIRIQFSPEGVASAVFPALAYAGMRTLTRVLTAIVPTSALLALLASLLWLGAALYLFVVVTWNRDDNWLAAGIIIGSSLLCGGLAADFIVQMIATGSLGQAALAAADASIGLLVRTIILVPVSGGFVAGARWIAAEIRRSGAWTS